MRTLIKKQTDGTLAVVEIANVKHIKYTWYAKKE
jgi:hypothetical protein